MATVDRLVVACELLDRSLRFYYEGDSNFASLNLAGAAEEILGAYAEKHGVQSAFSSMKVGGAALLRYLDPETGNRAEKEMGDLMNRAKNQTKHGHGPVSYNAEQEAKELLDRAVSNYYFLMNYYPELKETELIRRFNRELIGAP